MKTLGVSFLVLIVTLCNVGIIAGDKNDKTCQCLQLPQKSLKQLDSGCTNAEHSRSDQCINAVHQYCKQTRFPWFQPGENVPEMMGSIQSVRNNGQTEIACVKSKFYKKINMKVLRGFERSCTDDKSQSVECLEAVSELCQNRFGKEFAGMPQSPPSQNEPRQIQVACFKSVLKALIPTEELQKHHKRCNNILVSANQECFTAASNWCKSMKHSGGITQETTDTEIKVACYDALYVTKVPISGTILGGKGGKKQQKKRGRRSRRNRGKQQNRGKPQQQRKKPLNPQQRAQQQRAQQQKAQQQRAQQQRAQQRRAQLQRAQQQKAKQQQDKKPTGRPPVIKKKKSFIDQLIDTLKSLANTDTQRGGQKPKQVQRKIPGPVTYHREMET